ncbi:phosphoethanolamine transferase [Sulfitobacter guttiformis]|uniref:Lipid A ethanolaminephosphotransferase n=1 Tax=Sulfitobacter guttiformis TaxID=74349 RepID=A0A420DJH9_9RHOB|nr:phosphoethanolamine--lipid A transferase [Sulfitobacter guttiformis]KIN71812.1 Integral membrane protein [Sulfitobacter guttiformis KCTC 32187]RKE94372.1 lipid A ethanolaminephosphotransferase [Sulfitobacter guttiformis]
MTPFQIIKTRVQQLRSTYPLSPLSLSALVLVFIFCTANATFWTIGAEVFSGSLLSFAGFGLAIFLLTLAFFSTFGFPWTVKPFLIFMLILSAVTSYYMDTLGVIIDRDMIQNVMVTTITESKHLLTAGFILHVVLFGALPALVVAAVRVKRFGLLRTSLVPVLTLTLGIAVAAGLLMSDLKSYSSILRERKDYMSSFQPGAPLVATVRYAKMMARSTNVIVAAVGEDAVKGEAYSPERKPLLTIVVAGETARTQNFSLNGYGVKTNPRLEHLPVVSFTDVSSCGTATATSLPCMFSKFDRDGYSYEKGISNESVLDVLDHAGFHVEWWDNNTGDKGIAARVPTRSLTHETDPEFCAAGECMDGIFMNALAEYADTITEDTVLVLHQIGSHGPTYHLRYPAQFERFTPACNTAEFKLCSPDEIVNAYDNTIAYTDEILAQTIEFLDAQERLSTALIYVSDHGESLGEAGLYLHGSPYFMAPATQTKVPMILWMSQTFTEQFGLDKDCLAAKRDAPLSHDNLFHSLLGMLDVQTQARTPALDLFETCRNHQKVASK